MKPTFIIFYLLTISLCFYNCSGNFTKNKKSTIIRQPEFTDKGKTIDSLKKVYNCESIDYENWGDKKETDSCLTVCLINSKKVPVVDNPDNYGLQLKGIASAIKKSLTKPQMYKSFYIIFIKKDIFNGEEIKVHSGGGEIRSIDI